MDEPVFTPEQEARIQELVRAALVDKAKQIPTVHGSFATSVDPQRVAALIANLREHGLLGRP